jgi:putative ABC transport system permease protein
MIMSVYTGIEASNEKTEGLIDETITNTQENVEDAKQFIYEIEELTETQERMIQIGGGRGGGGGMGGGGYPGGGSTQTPITQAVIDNISSIDYIEAVIPIVDQRIGEIDEEEREQLMEMRNQDGGGFKIDMFNEFFDYFIQGVPLESSFENKYSILPSNIVSGRIITENDKGCVVIRDKLTEADSFFAGTGIGDYIDVQGNDMKVVGIYTSEEDRNNVYMSVSDAQKALGLNDQVSSLNVYAETKSAIDLIIYEIGELYPDLTATSYVEITARSSDFRQQRQDEQITEMEEARDIQISSYETKNSDIQNQGNMIIIISIITASLIVLFLMLYTVRERSKEIGILKALGFPGKNILSQFMIEGTVIGVIGGIIGIAIGVFAGPWIAEYILPSGSNVFATTTPSITLILIILGLTAALGAAGTIYPAWEASRKSPMEAMKHE